MTSAFRSPVPPLLVFFRSPAGGFLSGGEHSGMGEKGSNYVWRSKTNKSFIGQCHIETGNTWLRFKFNSDLGRMERAPNTHDNPMFILHDGKALALRGAVTVSAPDTGQMGTVTFTPQDEGFTEWHWTLTQDGQTYTEEGRDIFLQGEPKPARRTRVKKIAKKATTRRNVASRKKAAPKKRIAKAKKSRRAATRKSRGRRR